MSFYDDDGHDIFTLGLVALGFFALAWLACGVR